MDLSKFKAYEIVPGIASVTIAKHGIGFSKKAISELGNPDYVRLLINSEDNQLALVVADSSENGAVKCMAGKKPDDNRNFRINNKGLLYKVANMINCQFDNLNYKIIGEFFDDGRTMLIDLNRAKKNGENNDSDTDETKTDI